MIRALVNNPAFSLGWRLILVLLAGGAVFQVMTMDLTSGAYPGNYAGSATILSGKSPSGEDAVAATVNLYSAIAAHPLFYPSRKPWAPPPPPPVVHEPPPPPSLTSYSVIGIIVSGDARSALIKEQNDKKAILLTEGQELKGWTLKEITPERLRFVAGTADYEMVYPRSAGHK